MTLCSFIACKAAVHVFILSKVICLIIKYWRLFRLKRKPEIMQQLVMRLYSGEE